jgi:putative ABC transport system substrate-binding protein
MNKILCRLCLVVLLTGLTGLLYAGDVAVLMSSDAEVYQAALEGFRETSRHRIVSEYTMRENFSSLRNELTKIRSNNKPDVILAVGSAALGLAAEVNDIPVVHTLVFNPSSIIRPGVTNVTGIGMTPSANQALSLLKELNPKNRRVGVVFNPTTSGQIVSQARAVAQKERLQLVTREIRSPAEISAALKSLENEMDVLWLVPDETFLADEILQRVFLFSFETKIPVLGLSERHTQMGALLSLSYGSAKDMGRQAGEVANRLMGEAGETPMAHVALRQVKLTLNLKTARKLDVEVPDSIIRRADNGVKVPVYKDGEWWVFRIKTIYLDGKVEVEEHRVTFQNGKFESDDPAFLTGGDLAGPPSFLAFASVYIAEPGTKWLDFPLLAGKKWSFRYPRRQYYKGKPTWAMASAEVIGQVPQAVETQAGKFDAIEIHRVDSLSIPAYLTYFYSPQTKSVIKLRAEIHATADSSGRRFELELIAHGTDGTERKVLR